MRAAWRLIAAVLAVSAFLGLAARGADADGESSRRDPYVGYLYPAGGRRGAVVQVLAGGQNLRGVTAAYFSGPGVRATVVRYVRPLTPQQMQELRRRLLEAGESRRTGRRVARTVDPNEERVELPDHPLLRDLDKKSPQELRAIATRFLGAGAKRQMNNQIAETVEIEVTIDPDASSGDRELRLGTPAGLTNPVRFQVNVVPEICEEEFETNGPVLDVPVMLNGQIMPGDVDRFRFRAKKGRHLVVDVSARRLTPYLADAVPGWFQATAALYDAKGNEVAFVDDYRFEPDPVLFYDVPADGEYVLEIRDALYRGREDFVYRASVGEEPYITRMFPLGGPMGVAVLASIGGWNLPETRLALDTCAGGSVIRWAAAQRNQWPSNAVPYAVDGLPECSETAPDDDGRAPQRITLPVVVNGRIGRPGDVDVFAFEAVAGDEVVAEVEARRLSSPLDSLLTLTDAAGRVLAWNDDHDDPASGLVTHQADSYLRVRIPADGVYGVKIADAQRHGGPEYAYRLRIGPPRPDFEVFVTPSSLNVPAGRAVPVAVHVVRRDGFAGAVDLVLTDAPAGFVLDGASVPGALAVTRMTLTARAPFDGPLVLHLEGRARIGADEVRRPVVAADDRMQAFAYRRLVPAQELMVVVTGWPRGAPTVERVDAGPVRIPPGGAVQVRIATSMRAVPDGVRLELVDPPAGVTLGDVDVRPGGLSLVVKADVAAAKVGTADNLIVEILAPGGARAGRGAAGAERRISLGFLPAIAFEIMAK